MSIEAPPGGAPVERPPQSERKPISETLTTGSYSEMGTLVLDTLYDVPDHELWSRLARGEVTIEEIAYEGENSALDGESMANIVRALFAISEARFPGFSTFEPFRTNPLPEELTETQTVGAMAEKLVAFFFVSSDIAMYLSDKFSGGAPWRS